MDNNNGTQKDIVIKSGDKDLIEASIIFLKDIETEFKKYVESNKRLQKKEKKYSQNKNYFYVPELAIIKSPLTILNAPWGSGKTFFIENFIKLFIDKKIESKVFKKIIKIDAWKFSNSKNVNLDFIMNLSEIMLKTHKKWKININDFFKKLANKLIPTSINIGYVVGEISLMLEIAREKKSNEVQKKENKIIKEIENNQNPTIIFIDNIERLGNYSWDLLKTLIRLQEFSNYLIILSLNINKLEENKNNNKDEYKIEKYININSYVLKQDYEGYFSSLFDKKKEILAVSQIFEETIKGKNLSIR